MKSKHSFSRNLMVRAVRELAAIICIGVLFPGNALAAQTPQAAAPAPEQAAAKIPADQLDSLVAPIALYPDPLLSQTLVASTYPLEVIQLQQWLAQNKKLKDKALADAVKKQDWDPSIQSLAALPDVVKLLAENIKWTTDLGNAFLAQQNDVMDCGAAHAQEGQRCRKPEIVRTGEGGNQDRREHTGDRGGAGESPSYLCAQLQPDGGLRSACLCLSPDRLPAAGILRGGHGDLVWRRRRDGCGVGRRLGLQLRLGWRQQQHHHQQQQ